MPAAVQAAFVSSNYLVTARLSVGESGNYLAGMDLIARCMQPPTLAAVVRTRAGLSSLEGAAIGAKLNMMQEIVMKTMLSFGFCIGRSL